MAPAQVWSRFEYEDACSGKPTAVPIEPLVGLLRHPAAHPACRPGDGSLDWTLEERHDPPAYRVQFQVPWKAGL